MRCVVIPILVWIPDTPRVSILSLEFSIFLRMSPPHSNSSWKFGTPLLGPFAFVCTVREISPISVLSIPVSFSLSPRVTNVQFAAPCPLRHAVFYRPVFCSRSNDASLFSFLRAQDDSTSHSDHQDPISLAVEMAAVNHTILALARQGANEIKTEALDDDWYKERGGSKREVT